ncbi:hypothetical protein M0805_007436 [Coniferiporia weirii]|nr:hypothetical protein M0805_007436 [Coniferiporia weirii]
MLNQARWAPSQIARRGSPYDQATYVSTDTQQTARMPSTWAAPQASSWSDPALRLIDEVANSMDVDIQVPSGPSSTSLLAHISLVIDTNVLLSFLDVLQQFVEDIGKNGELLSVVIPGVVVQELDYQKADKSRALCWSARMASTWILSKLKERRYVKGQAYPETLQRSGSWKRRDSDTSNDELIVDCCLYLREKKGHNVVALSQDKNFCSTAESQGIHTINPRDYIRWSSRSLAQALFGDHNAKLNRFADYKETSRPRGVSQALDDELGVQPIQTTMDDDGMEIDVDPSVTLEPPPQHLLDDLHDQVLSHFSIILSELLRRVAPTLFTQAPSNSGAALSIYAPSSSSRPAKDWSANEMLSYLCSARRLARKASPDDVKSVVDGASRLTDFFTHKYCARGRSGQHWSRADWASCLNTLGAVGRVFEDGAILNSLAQLAPQVELVFQRPMRPTGMY